MANKTHVPDKPSVFIADDHSLIRVGIRTLLEQMGQFEIVGEAIDGRQTLAMVLERKPDIVLLDIDMPDLSGIDVALALQDAASPTRVVMLSASSERADVLASIRAGSRGYLVKDLLLGELEVALRSVMSGKQYLSPQVVHHVTNFLAGSPEGAENEAAEKSPLDLLTDRQRDVLAAIARGLSTKLIARELNISPKTVEFHRAQITERLGTHDIATLVRLALKHGLVEDV